ncbi:hypothetical protein QLX08_005754 [Tetragonisca angustula]|uniref:Uncharacterized protein n=1 Tax=Tetragonisca angustula TaxID=166442 RepID=A0AAW0ZYS6_9HYME
MIPEKYILKIGNLDVIDDFFDDIQYLDEKKEKVSDSVKPLYEELKKIYDWNVDESGKSKPRIKGDQRMYHESNDKPCTTEPSKNQTDPSEVHDGPTETSASSPNLLPLLLVHAGSGKSEIGERIYQSVSSGEREGPATAASANVSQSNYFALKSTDDMFKGGPEQGNSTGEKLRGPARAIETAREWQAQKVSGVRNDGAEGRDGVSWSLTDRRQYIDTDSQRSACGDRKYPALPRERVQNIDREKQTIVSSRDLHESFVEPVEWFDDFDKDARVRLARGLKTVDTDALVPRPVSAAAKYERSLVNGSIDGAREMGNGTSLKTEDSPALVTYSRSSLDTRLSDGDGRAKREIASPYDTYYEDEENRYNYQETEDDDADDDLQFVNSYEDADEENRRRGLSSEENHERHDYLEDDYGDDVYEEDVDLKRKVPARVGQKHRKKASKKRKKKERVGKSSESHEKRRHRKKHSNDSKSHKRGKSASKSGSRRNVKKSKATQNEGESRSEKEGVDRDDVEGEGTTSSDDDSQREKFTTLLITTDDMEDESQMDSALHGELAGKIVQQIFDQVEKNEELRVSLGPGLYQKHKTKDTAAAEKSYRETLDDDDIRNTKELLNRIMLLLNRLIFDEVQRKTCISLPSDLIEFLDWMLQVDTRAISLGQPPALPLVHEEYQDHFHRDKFLFQSFPNDRVEAEINELYAKIELIKSLIKEYSALTDKDKAKIESIQEYLSKQLDLLLEYIEARKEAEKKGKSKSILQYQIGTSNASNASYSARPDSFSPLMNALPNHPNEQLFQENGIGVPRRGGERVTRSVDKRAKYNKTRRKRKKRGKRHGERHKGASAIDQSRREDSNVRPATREKREYLDKAFWDSLDSGYEEPLIYHSMDMNMSVESNANGGTEIKKEEKLEDAGGKNTVLDPGERRRATI